MRAHSLKIFSKSKKYLSELPIICQMSEIKHLDYGGGLQK